MHTLYLNGQGPQAAAATRQAAALLRAGQLVAFPTETVYGLGANAWDPAAVRKVFLAKGRPADNPLIVHVARLQDLSGLVSKLDTTALQVIRRFWPGPLTLVLPATSAVPQAVTAGLATVAVRMPAHPVARQLIRQAGIPVAAPSANTSGKPSPTTARHVLSDLAGRIAAVLDGGPAYLGVESTVLDLSIHPPAILRPGSVTIEELQQVIGLVLGTASGEPIDRPQAPGMKYRHYAPRARVYLVEGEPAAVAGQVNAYLGRWRTHDHKVGVLLSRQTAQLLEQGRVAADHVEVWGDRDAVDRLAATLYGALRQFDAYRVDVVLAETVPPVGLGLAVMNRLRKAAGNRVLAKSF